METSVNGRQWKGVAWSRTLPRPVRNGRFYRLGHTVAVILAGHAHKDGGGITVSVKTVAEEAWCTLAEAQEALDWLLCEKWFSESMGPRGMELACNLDVTRPAGSEVEDRAAHQRARAAAKQKAYRDRKKASQLPDNVTVLPVTHSGNAPVTQSGNEEGCVTEDSYRRYRGELPELPGAVTETGNAPGNNRRSEAHKTLKTHEDPKEDPKPRSTADASDAPDALFAVDATEEQGVKKKQRPPHNVLADLYHEALEGNINYKAVMMVIKSTLKSNEYAEVERGVRVLAEMPEKPFTRQVLFSAMRGRLGGGLGHTASKAPFPAAGEYPDDPFAA